jgi:tetratricopeptide (TPR) repeat protein
MRAALLVVAGAAAFVVGTVRAEPAPPAAAPAPLFDNLGDHHHRVTTRSKQAQRYFDQGLRLIYAFNHDEAIRSFKAAAHMDPSCAMAYWGIAYALGPNYNMPLDSAHHKAAYEAAQHAATLAPKVSAPEQAYIAAIAMRYSNDANADRTALDLAFADAMRQLARRYPTDLDAATLFAESMMDLRPWDLWTRDGQPQPGTVEIVETLEGVLKKDPNHPGANHYYIHAVEASPHPERALASAGRLRTLVPGAGHLVHMPSHVYMRVGRYPEATDANRRAVAVDERYIAAAKPDGVYAMMYYPHNIHFLWAAASMEGRSAEAIAAARKVGDQLKPEMVRAMPATEFVVPTPLFALVRFGRWPAILQEPAPPDDLEYALGVWHYARGVAFVATGQLDDAAKEQAALAALAEAMPADRIIGDNTPAKALLQIATETLAGEWAARRGDADAAVRRLEAAVRLQDALPYTEPPPWYYPVRQSLGAVLLTAGRPAEAEGVYREDLRRNPENGWSLYGLTQSLRAQRKDTEAAKADVQFRQAWAHADVQLTASRF